MRVPLRALGLAILLVATACRTTILAEGTRPSAEIGPDGRIPVAAFFRRPALSHVALSPDGRRLAGVEAHDGVEFVVVRALDGGETRRLGRIERTSDEPSKTIRTLGWASDDRVVVGVGMLDPWSQTHARRSRLAVLPLDGEPRYLGADWPGQSALGTQDAVASWLPHDPEHLLLNLWLWPDDGASAHLVDVRDGALQTVVPPHEDAVLWMADHRGVVRAGITVSEDGSSRTLLARVSAGDEFAVVHASTPDTDELEFAGFAPDPRTLYVYRARKRGRRAVYTFDIPTKTVGELVFEHPAYDVASIVCSEVDGRLISIRFADDIAKAHFVDAAFRGYQQRINALLPGRSNGFVSMDRDERIGIVASSGDVHPPRYYRFDTATGELTHLFDAYPELGRATLAPMRAVRFEVRDGSTIQGYLTLPPGTPDDHAPLPAIVLPHGGPWARDVWGWNPEVQLFASRGFAVLQPNFRGSAGFGQAFLAQGFKAWDGAMLDDVIDAARWLVLEGIADRERVGVYGGSYGGYAALRVLALEPALFRAGASLAGVTDLVLLGRQRRHSWGQEEPFARLVGDPDTDRDALERSSPIFGADRIRVPVLIAHGTRDPNVGVAHAEEMLDALAGAGRHGEDVEAYLYEGELHGFIDERNAIDFYTRLVAFFERHLKGDVAPPSAPAATDAGAAAGEAQRKTAAATAGHVISGR